MEQRLSQSIVQSKRSRFAMHIAEYIHRRQNAHASLVLATQLLRYGTSINDSVAEAIGRHTNTDFVATLEIAAKWARETGFWLRLIRETQSHDQQELADLLKECDGLLRMLNSIMLQTRSTFAADDSGLHLSTQHSALPSA